MADRLVLAIGGKPWFLFRGKFSCDLSFMNMATRFQSWTFWDRGSQAEAELFCDLNFGSHMASFLLCSTVQAIPGPCWFKREENIKPAPHWEEFQSSVKESLRMFSHIWLFVTIDSIALQAPVSVEFSRQEHWSGLPFPTPRDLPNEGNQSCISYTSCIGRQIFFFLSLHLGAPGKPLFKYNWYLIAHIERNNSINFETYIHQQNHHYSQDNDHVHHQKKFSSWHCLPTLTQANTLLLYITTDVFEFSRILWKCDFRIYYVFGLTSWIIDHYWFICLHFNGYQILLLKVYIV